MKVLLTGFGPFGESPINPSQKLVDSLPDVMLNEIQMIKAVLPIEHDLGPKALLNHIQKAQPDGLSHP